MQRLILFDIDGTLLSSDGAAPRAFRRALEAVFGTSGPGRGYSFAGKTDPQIARDLLRAAGIDEATIDAGLPEAWALYVAGLEQEIQRVTTVVYPGVHPLLERIDGAREDAMLGLLTGNLEGGARVKLASAGIRWERFRVGAYGSDHADRAELPEIAVRRAEQVVGRRFAGKEIVVIGDTPYDISCGEQLGVRTIAVATGSYSEEELAACEPDHLFASLADTEAVWRAIFG